MRGTAVTTNEPRSLRKQTKVTAAMTVKCLKPETHSGSWSWFAGGFGVEVGSNFGSSLCSSDGRMERLCSFSFCPKSSASEGCCEGGFVASIFYQRIKRINDVECIQQRGGSEECRLESGVEGGG